MVSSQVSAQGIESARAVIVVIVAGVVIFWKLALRVLLALIAVAVGLGLLMLLQDAH